jgi:hypothetical protein
MNDKSKISPELEQTLDEHVRWVNQATELALSEGAIGVQKAIDALEDEQLRGMIFVLVTTRAGDVERLRTYAHDKIAREQFDQLDNRGSVTLH